MIDEGSRQTNHTLSSPYLQALNHSCNTSSYLSTNCLPRLQHLPNPYPVPDRPFRIDFHEPGQEELLPMRATINCIHKVYNILNYHIHYIGDGPIPIEGGLYFSFNGVEFAVYAMPAPTHSYVLSYSDTLHILSAFCVKMQTEGYRFRFGEVLLSGGGEHVGNAVIARIESEGRGKLDQR